MRKAMKLTAVLLVSVIILTSCAGLGKLQPGSWDGDTFTNEWSNIKLTLPEGFRKLSGDEIKEIMNAGNDAMVNDGTMSQSEIDLSQLTYIYDLVIMDTEDEISMVGLMYQKALGVSSAEKYLDSTIDELVTNFSAMGLTAKKLSPSNITIAGGNYYKLGLSMEIPIDLEGNVMSYYQEYAAFKQGDMFIALIIAYTSDTKGEIYDFLSSVTKAK